MHPTSPGAFMLSATLHGVLAILALFFGYVTSQDEPRQKILELVAGEGDNFMAQEAPALGKSDGLKTNVPKVPEPKPAPVEPTPVAPPPSTPAPPTPKQTEQPVPNFAKDIKRTIIRAESQAKRDVKKEQEKEKKRADEEAKKLTKEEFDRANKTKSNPPTKVASAKSPRVDEGFAKGVAGGSTANKVGGAGGKAMKSDNTDVLAAYDKLFKDRLRREFEAPPGLSDSLKVEVEVRSNADGSLSGARIRTSSGSPEFDRAVLDAIRRVRMPDRPDKKGEVVEFIFTMRERGEG